MPKKRNYDSALVDKAVQEVKSGLATYRTASNKYGIPKSTIEFKLKNPGHRESFGPPTILTTIEEQSLSKWILDLAKRGFPRKKVDILCSVQKFLEENPRKNPFKNNKPGDGWLKAFLKRHPEITERTSEGVTSASSCVSENDIRKWFSEIELYINEKGLEEAMKDPSRVYNGDETGFQICPKTGKVYAAKGSKNVYTIEQGSAKETLTVMFSFSANGSICCPMIVYPYKRIPEKISMSVNPSWGIGRSDNGWMTAETFYEYIANVFYPHLLEKNILLPVILFVDGHKSHLTYDLSILCNQLQIEVIALYPNATRILQPADVSAFRPIKATWQRCVREWHDNNPGENLNKLSFAPLLQSVVDSSIKPEILINGFKICGLYPFNPDAVDYSKCLAKGTDNTNTKDVSRNTPVITYHDFVKIVGPEKIMMFESINKIVHKEDNENFWNLYHLWRHFKIPHQNISKHEVKNIMITENIELPETSPSQQDDPSNESNLRSGEMDASPKDQKFETALKKITILENIALPSISYSQENNSKNKNLEEDIVECREMNQQNDNMGPLIQHLPSEEISTQQTQSDEHDHFNASEPVKLLNKYLVYPNVPQRKGKKNTQKFLFAITSRKYQEMFEAKRDMLKKAEEEKEVRKRKREVAKMEKNNKKSKTITCNQCNKLIKSKSFQTCDECKKYFHKSCVLQNHQIHIPDEGTDDLYLCHKCYKQDSDNEKYSEEEELETIDPEKDKEENEEETEALINMKVIKNKKNEDCDVNDNNLSHDTTYKDYCGESDDEMATEKLFHLYKSQYKKMGLDT